MLELNKGILPPHLDVIEALAESMPNGGKWCCWVAVKRDGGKIGKVPHSVSGGSLMPIGCDKPEQWADFQTCQNFLETNGLGARAVGLGILVGSNPKDGSARYSSGLVAVDVDDCINEAGELREDLPVEVLLGIKAMQEAGVYLEVSPSGKGLRGLYVGEKAAGIREKASADGVGREIYSGLTVGRFVTLTGRSWQNFPASLVSLPESFSWDIADWLGLLVEQAEARGAGGEPRNLPPMSDVDIIAKVKQGGGSGRGKRLWEGDLSGHGDDWSAADAALCRLIAQWSDNASQIERVWSGSAMAKRDKFQRKDYRERTINMALSSARKDAAKSYAAVADKAGRVSAALDAGDVGGALASAVARWGGKVPATLEAAETILSLDQRLIGAFAFDAFCGTAVKLRSLRECLGEAVPPDTAPVSGQTWTDADTLALTIWLAKAWGVSIKSGLVDDALTLAARRRPINLVADALSALVWDGKPRLSCWLVDYLQADATYDPPRYLEAIGRAWMIGTVARALEPGIKHDGVLVLEGGQGLRKSLAARTLASAVAPHAFREGLPPLTQGQEAEMALRGVWICELAELAFMDRATAEHTKSFISRMVDTFRPKFGKRDVSVPRTVSFIGTTNHSQYVQDSTGGRRWWSFRVGKPIDTDALHDVAPQLFAEALTAFRSGERHHLTDAAVVALASASQATRLERSGWDELIEERLTEHLASGKLGNPSEFYCTALDLFRLVAPESESDFYKVTRPFSEALVRCGFEKTSTKRRSMWQPGAELLGHILSAGN